MSYKNYKLLDAGNYKKLEQFGEFTIVRPCLQAFWDVGSPRVWKNADAEYSKQENAWKIYQKELPKSWLIKSLDGIIWQIQPNSSGNLGVFTEHWEYNQKLLSFFSKKETILNLFSYTGSNCLPLAKAGYEITVVDSSKSAITGFVKNLELNGIDKQGKRLILEDVIKFMKKEVRRNKQYGSIILDPPSFGKGTKNEVFSLEKNFLELLDLTIKLLKEDSKVVITLHSTDFNLKKFKEILNFKFKDSPIKIEKIQQKTESGLVLPGGFLAFIG